MRINDEGITWRIMYRIDTDAADFLDLTREDSEYIEMKLELSQSLKELRVVKI